MSSPARDPGHAALRPPASAPASPTADRPPSPAPGVPRNFNLDVLRAAAISMVVVSHSLVLDPIRHPALATLGWLGQFGVDLFFVLSGWLIGGLFWSEWRSTGRVEWSRFWLRRALRTIPPYFVVLPFAWAAVRLGDASRTTPFNPAYLVFAQNYLPRPPYFTISWSLCVEEHFYLVLPALTLAVLACRLPVGALFAVLAALSPFCRAFIQPVQSFDDFDRGILATHLRLEGLVLGFSAAWLSACHPGAWKFAARALRRLAAPALIGFVFLPWMPEHAFYRWGPSLVALVWFIVLTAAATAAPWRIPAARAVGWIAASSYSIYLVHALVLHSVHRAALAAGTGAFVDVAYWAVAFAAVAACGGLFAWAVEKPSLRLRDAWVPRRPASRPV